MSKQKGPVELGDLVEDMVTKAQGVVVQYVQCLTGCDRVVVQPQVGKDQKLPDLFGVDVTTVRVLQKKAVTPVFAEPVRPPLRASAPGGPSGPVARRRY